MLCSFAVQWILVILMCQFSIGLRMWEYEPLSLECTSADPSKIKLDLRIVRVKRGEFAISGSIDWNYDIDDTTMIEAVSHSSNTGAEEDYVAMPWTISKMTFKEYVNDHYKEIVYKNLKDCSNMPSPDSVYPWPRATLKFDKCVLTGAGLPDSMPDAYVRFAFKVTGEVNWNITIIIRIMQKLDIFG